jgi:hypothetical protein
VISPDRQNHFAHLIVEEVWQDDLVDYVDDGRALTIAKRVVSAFAAEVDQIDDLARKKISTMKRTVMEGTDEYNALYDRFYQEELKKRGHSI